MNSDQAADPTATLARILVLEAQRAANLVREAREPERVAIRAIADRQQADALAFARRTIY